MDPRAERQARRELVAQRAAARETQGRNRQGLVRFRRLRRRVGGWLLDLCAPLLLRLLAMTWRVQRIGEAGLSTFRGGGPWLVAMWHGRMLALMPLRLHRARNLGVLVSPSDDGGLATKALHHFGYRPIRGSLSRGGARALRAMNEQLAAGGQLVLTPDGPRGPRHLMNPGVAWLARASGAAIVPLGLACDRAWRLRSWDRFLIPKPFARVVAIYGDPVHVATTADDADLEAVTQMLRNRLLDAELSGFRHLGTSDDLDLEPPLARGTPLREQLDPDTTPSVGPGS